MISEEGTPSARRVLAAVRAAVASAQPCTAFSRGLILAVPRPRGVPGKGGLLMSGRFAVLLVLAASC